jgi:hypothetical protein
LIRPSAEGPRELKDATLLALKVASRKLREAPTPTPFLVSAGEPTCRVEGRGEERGREREDHSRTV